MTGVSCRGKQAPVKFRSDTASPFVWRDNNPVDINEPLVSIPEPEKIGARVIGILVHGDEKSSRETGCIVDPYSQESAGEECLERVTAQKGRLRGVCVVKIKQCLARRRT